MIKPIPTNIEDTKSNSGWISPEGLFYECKPKKHIDLADEICISDIFTPDKKAENYERVLEINGWIKLSNGVIQYYINDPKKDHINMEQKDIIIKYFISRGEKEVSLFGMKESFSEFLDNKH